MPKEPVRDANLEEARAWLAGHGLADAQPTPLLATRLAARRRKRLTAAVLLAVFICAVALVYVTALPAIADTAVDGLGPVRRRALLVVTAMVIGLVLAQSLLDRWVRRVDQRAGATLPRRAAHPLRPGWRAVLGVPYAAFTAGTFAVAAALAIAALPVRDASARYSAVVLLIGLCGAAVSTLAQLHHILTHPVVADDEVVSAPPPDESVRGEPARTRSRARTRPRPRSTRRCGSAR